jgi:hypothetical protein
MVAPIGRVYADMQAVHFLRKTIGYAMNGKTVDVGVLPAGAVMVRAASGVVITTAFNGDTTNTVTIGPSTDTDLWATGSSLATLGFVVNDAAVTQLIGASDVLVQAVVTSTASASAGSAEIVIAYIPDIDG